MAAAVAPAQTTPTTAGSNADGTDTSADRLRAPALRFKSPSTLRILDEGLLGTWSLVGMSVGQTSCIDWLGAQCLDVAMAWLGLEWRPKHSPVAVFGAVGIASSTMIPADLRPIHGRGFVGLSVDLPRPSQRRR
ncbi:MAG: hypothetical protein AB1Z98_06005 [Nannocystaceae bacterium]